MSIILQAFCAKHCIEPFSLPVCTQIKPSMFSLTLCAIFLYVIYINNDLVIIHIISTVGAYQLCVVIYIILCVLHKGFVRCAIVLHCYVKDENAQRTVLMIYFYDNCLFVIHVGHLMAEPHSYSYMYLMLFLSKFV